MYGSPSGKFIVAFEPLDGSSNIDINGQIGTIFTIYPARHDVPPDSDEQFAQPGSAQLCAGYVLYGPASMLVMSTGVATRCYTLDLTHGGFLLTQESMQVPPESREFSANMANYRYWGYAVQRFLTACCLHRSQKQRPTLECGHGGGYASSAESRWIVLYPEDERAGNQNAKFDCYTKLTPSHFIGTCWWQSDSQRTKGAVYSAHQFASTCPCCGRIGFSG